MDRNYNRLKIPEIGKKIQKREREREREIWASLIISIDEKSTFQTKPHSDNHVGRHYDPNLDCEREMV